MRQSGELCTCKEHLEIIQTIGKQVWKEQHTKIYKKLIPVLDYNASRVGKKDKTEAFIKANSY